MTKHWALQDAKARLSELVRAAQDEPQIITFRGEPAVEVRGLKGRRQKKTMTLLEALQSAPSAIADLVLPPRKTPPDWWSKAPKLPQLKLPPRKRERMRKIDL
jgi:antitoxin Phd